MFSLQQTNPDAKLPNVLKAHRGAVDVHDVRNRDVGAEIHHPEDVVQRGLVAVVAVIVEDRRVGARQALAVARRLGLRVNAANLGQAGVQVSRLPAPPQQVDEGAMQEEERVARAVGHVEHDAAHAAVPAAVRGALDAVPRAVPRVFLEARFYVDVGGAVQAVER